MSAETVLWCLQSKAAGCLSKSRVTAQSLYKDLSLASSPGPAGMGSEDLSRASAAFRNKLVGETELCIQWWITE